MDSDHHAGSSESEACADSLQSYFVQLPDGLKPMGEPPVEGEISVVGFEGVTDGGDMSESKLRRGAPSGSEDVGSGEPLYFAQTMGTGPSTTTLITMMSDGPLLSTHETNNGDEPQSSARTSLRIVDGAKLIQTTKQILEPSTSLSYSLMSGVRLGQNRPRNVESVSLLSPGTGLPHAILASDHHLQNDSEDSITMDSDGDVTIGGVGHHGGVEIDVTNLQAVDHIGIPTLAALSSSTSQTIGGSVANDGSRIESETLAASGGELVAAAAAAATAAAAAASAAAAAAASGVSSQSVLLAAGDNTYQTVTIVPQPSVNDTQVGEVSYVLIVSKASQLLGAKDQPALYRLGGAGLDEIGHQSLLSAVGTSVTGSASSMSKLEEATHQSLLSAAATATSTVPVVTRSLCSMGGGGDLLLQIDENAMGAVGGEQKGAANEQADPLDCPYCSYKSTKPYLLNRHMRSHSEDRPFKCQTCQRSFKSTGSLTNHVHTHTGTRPHGCKHCESRFTTGGELVRHMRYKHTFEKPHHCTRCDYSSVELSKLKRHMRSHTGERPYPCDHCDYASPDHYKLKRHMRTHTGEKPYECDICHAKFTQSNSVKAHKLIHSGNKPVYQCEYCPATCGRKTDLKIHTQKLHTALDIPLPCKKCLKVFPDRYSYKLHTKTHEGEQCFRCELCPYAALNLQLQQMHVLQTHGEKRHICSDCGEAFRLVQLLRHHSILSHQSEMLIPLEKQFRCLNCHRTFVHEDNLKRHQDFHQPGGPLFNNLEWEQELDKADDIGEVLDDIDTHLIVSGGYADVLQIATATDSVTVAKGDDDDDIAGRLSQAGVLHLSAVTASTECGGADEDQSMDVVVGLGETVSDGMHSSTTRDGEIAERVSEARLKSNINLNTVIVSGDIDGVGGSQMASHHFFRRHHGCHDSDAGSRVVVMEVGPPPPVTVAPGIEAALSSSSEDRGESMLTMVTSQGHVITSQGHMITSDGHMTSSRSHIVSDDRLGSVSCEGTSGSHHHGVGGGLEPSLMKSVSSQSGRLSVGPEGDEDAAFSEENMDLNTGLFSDI